MSFVEVTRIDNFVCPACGEIIKQVAARDGVVKGWCPTAKKEIKVVIKQNQEEEKTETASSAPVSYLDTLKQKRERLLKEVVSAREDGDLKENSPYHAAREQLGIIDEKILKEEERIRQTSQGT